MIASLATSVFLQGLQTFFGRTAKNAYIRRYDWLGGAALAPALSGGRGPGGPGRGLIRNRLAEIEALEGTDDGERILVTRDYRILLPDRFGMEIRLRPLVKTVFLLFLRHPEGIRFGNLRDYRQELMDLYQGITRRGDLRQIAESVDRLVDPKDNGGAVPLFQAAGAARLRPHRQGRRPETHPAGPQPGRMGINV